MAQINLNVSLQTGMSTQQLKALEDAVKGIASTFESIKPDRNLSATINALTRQYNALAKAAQSVQKADNKAAIDAEKLAKARHQSAEAAQKERLQYEKGNTEIAKREKISNSTRIASEKHTAAMKRQAQRQEKLNKKTAEGTKAQEQNSESILGMVGKFAKWQIAATLLMQPLNLLRDAISSINETLVETESRVIALQRVLPSGSASDSEISGAMFGLAQKYGQTIENVSDIANNFARTGMSWTETLEATEAALLALNVAELDATQSSDGLIAVMTQFKYEASDLMSIINMLNKTADNFPVTTEKLLKALQRTGSTAANANISLEDTIGLITTLSQATGRRGENLGTAINSLISYSQKDSALNIFAQLSETTDEIVKKYRQGGASILDVWRAVSAEMKSLDETQQNLLSSLANDEDIKNLDSELHDELGDIFEQTQDVYGTANTYRKSYFISLLENIDTVAEASKTAHQSEGYSQEENLKYLETYEARQNTLTAKWQELANDEQGILKFKKGLVDIGIVALDIVDGLGGIKTVLAQIAVIGVTAFAWFKPVAIATAFSRIKAGITGLIGIIPRAITVWKAYAAGIVKVNTAMRATEPIIGLVVTALVGLIFYASQADERLQEAYDTAISKIDELDSKIKDNERLIEEATNANGDNRAYINRLEYENKLLKEQKDLEEDKAKEAKQKLHDDALEKLRDNKGYQYGKLLSMSTSGVSTRYEYTGNLYQALDYELTRAEESGFVSYFLKEYYSDFIDLISKLDYSQLEPETIRQFDGYIDRYNALFNIQGEITDEQKEQDKNLQDQNKTLDDMSDKYEDIADALKEARDAEQDAQKLLDKQNALLEAQRALAEAIAKARRDYVLDVLDDYVSSLEEANRQEELQQSILEARQEAILEYLELQRQSTEETLSLEEKRLEVEKARQALLDAQNQRNVRVRNAQTGIWEYQANAKDVASAEEALANSIDSFNSFLEEQMWSELSEYIKDGNTDTAEIEKIISKWQREWIGNDSPAWLNSVEQILSPSGTTIVDANEKVQSAVEALNKYLKDEAVKELKELIESGNASSDTIRETLSKWMSLDGTGELATWGNDLADKLSEAIESGFYDASKVASAQQKVRDAEQALSEHIINAVWDEVSDLFKSGNASRSALASVIQKYQRMGVSSDVIAQILNTINGILGDGNSVEIEDLFPRDTETNSDYTHRPTYPVTDPDDPDYVDYFPYDNGGILNGMGGIKATAASEAVLPPSLTSKIIQPASNEAFTNFANSLGILYGVSERLARPSVVSNYNRGNDSHDTHYTLNGVPISASSADRYTIGELFESLAFFKS